jgi:hypothetical protein
MTKRTIHQMGHNMEGEKGEGGVRNMIVFVRFDGKT